MNIQTLPRSGERPTDRESGRFTRGKRPAVSVLIGWNGRIYAVLLALWVFAFLEAALLRGAKKGKAAWVGAGAGGPGLLTHAPH